MRATLFFKMNTIRCVYHWQLKFTYCRNILPMLRNWFMCHRFLLTKVSLYHGFIGQFHEGSCISWYPFHTVKSYTILFTLLCYVEITNVIMWLGPDRRKIYYDSVRRNNRSNSCDVSKDPFDKVLSSKNNSLVQLWFRMPLLNPN